MRKSSRTRAGLLGILATAFSFSACGADVAVVGWIERARLDGDGLVLAAKLDTGADTSSLHASDIRWQTREDGDWVVFDVANERGEKVQFERKVIRVARIKRIGGGTQKRPTVMMGLCLGRVYRQTQITLVDRSGFNYELLVGRRFLAHHFVVDAARTHTTEPDCREEKTR